MNQKLTVLQKILMSLSFSMLCSCGIEVGNPSEPTPVPTKAQADRDTILQLATTQNDEAMSTLLESFLASTPSQALRLLSNDRDDTDGRDEKEIKSKKNRTGSCDPQSQNLKVAFQDDDNVERKEGKSTKQVNLADSMTRSVAAELSSSETLGCASGSASGPLFDWSTLSSLTVQAQSSRSRVRKLTLASDPNSVVSESTLKSTVQTHQTLQRVATKGSLFQLRKTTTFSSSSELFTKSTAYPSGSTLQMELSTLAEEPFVTEEVVSQSGVRSSATLVSGALSAVQGQDLKVILRYENLPLSSGGSCHPTQGSIQGTIYKGTGVASPSSRFQILFSQDNPVLRYSDGTEVDLVLEACQL